MPQPDMFAASSSPPCAPVAVIGAPVLGAEGGCIWGILRTRHHSWPVQGFQKVADTMTRQQAAAAAWTCIRLLDTLCKHLYAIRPITAACKLFRQPAAAETCLTYGLHPKHCLPGRSHWGR